MIDADYDKIMTAFWKAQDRHDFWHGLLASIKQWACHEEDITLSIAQRIFYTVKTLICMVSRRRSSYWAKSSIIIAIFDNEHLGSCGGAYPDWYSHWTQVVVGEGYLKNWSYDIYTDANA